MMRVNAIRWQAHLEAAQAQGKAITEYVREHGLSLYSLYAARKALRAGAQQDGNTHEATRPVRSPFAAVHAQRLLLQRSDHNTSVPFVTRL